MSDRLRVFAVSWWHALLVAVPAVSFFLLARATTGALSVAAWIAFAVAVVALFGLSMLEHARMLREIDDEGRE